MKGEGAGGSSANPGNLLMLGLSIIFISVGLIILPVSLDGIASVLDGTAHAGISASYTGLSPVLKLCPLLILISFLSASVISGFFGIRKVAGGQG